MEKVKTVLLIIVMVMILFGGFGGGGIIWYFVAFIIKPNPIILETGFYITTLVPIPFCWLIASKIGEKLL